MFIPDPGSWFYPSRIPDPKKQQKRKVKKICCHTFFRHKFPKIENYFIFEVLKEKIWANFRKLIELFTQKVVTKLSKIYGFGIRNPRSVIRKKPIPDPGSRGQKGTGSRIRIRNKIRDPEKTYSGSRIQGSKRHRIPDPQHCFLYFKYFCGSFLPFWNADL